MLGNFQQSNLRIEVKANQDTIRHSLIKTEKLREWMFPQTLASDLPDTLDRGLIFTSKLGIIEIEHTVELLEDNCISLILSKGIDGYHEWCWGDGWLQSKLEGVSLLPLQLAHTWSLLRLRQFIQEQQR